MAKRGGSELNHENWDQDAEPESAGIFKKASEGEIQGRVIRKARRRNIGGEEPAKKNAFSSFGGFSAVGKPAASDAAAGGFGFLKSAATTPAFGSVTATASSPNSEPSKSSFSSFMAPAATEPAKSTFGSFVFGKSDESKDPPAKKMATFGAVADEKTGEKSSSSKPSFGDTGGFSFGASKGTSSSVSGGFSFGASAAAASESSGGFSFGAPPKSSTESETKTVAPFAFGSASTKTSDSEVKSPSGFSFGASASKSPAGSPPETKSPGFVFGVKSSATASPAAKDEKSAAPPVGFSFGATTEKPADKPSSSAFAFGAKSSPVSTSIVPMPSFAAAASSDKPAFSLGSTTTTTEKPTVSSGPFSEKPAAAAFAFGAKPAEESSAKNAVGGFSFGSSTTATSEASKSGIFGASATPAPFSNGFSTKSNEKSDSAAAAASSSSSLVKETMKPFASKPFGGGIGSAADTSEKDDEYDEEYLAHLSALNVQVTAWIKKHVDDNPLVILSPIFKDYEKHLKDIASKYPPRSVTAAAAKPAAAPSPKKSLATTEAVKTEAAAGGSGAASVGFTFGSGLASKPAATIPATTGGFSFGSSGSSGGMFSAPPVPSSEPAAPAGDGGGADQEDEDQPPKVEIKQVTEEDALYSKKCKLFYKKDGNYVEKGVGMMYLKTADSGKTQLLMRADTNLGNILLNIILNKDIPTTRVGKNNVMLVCVPNPPVDPKVTDSQPTPMLIRVKTSEDADDLKSKLDDYKAK